VTTRAIVIAAGEGSRWDDHEGVPKHLAVINGERLIDRTARLFSPHAEVLVVGREPRYETPYSRRVPPRLNDRHFGADKFLSSRHLWNRDGRTLVLYGDVFFTEAAVRTIIEWPHRDWYLFGRFGPSRIYGGDRGECFAQSFYPDNIPDHLAALRGIVVARRLRHISSIGGWQHYRAMEGFNLDAHLKGPRFVEIDDATDDLDYPEDLPRIRAAVE
jgi:MobA-like NTP transferase domain